jgi:serine/threonine protein kinase
MAPEVMSQKEAYSNKSDLWSLGITVLELIEGKAPNESKNSI